MHRFHRDDRGLALAIVGFVALVVVCGLLFALMNPTIGGLADHASQQSNDPVVQDQVDRATQIWGLILFFVIFLGLIGLIVRATVESRGPA